MSPDLICPRCETKAERFHCSGPQCRWGRCAVCSFCSCARCKSARGVLVFDERGNHYIAHADDRRSA